MRERRKERETKDEEKMSTRYTINDVTIDDALRTFWDSRVALSGGTSEALGSPSSPSVIPSSSVPFWACFQRSVTVIDLIRDTDS